MSKINDFSDYTSKYNTNADYSYLFGATQAGTANGSFSLVDYASIKSGSYGKLLKAYYAKQDADKAGSGIDSVQKSTMIKSGADTLKNFFAGYNSFADKISMKANSISNAAARSCGTYKSNGAYNNALSELASRKVDKEV